MAIEKQGATRATDIRELARMAEEEKKTLVIDMKRYDAVVVVATGRRAKLLKRLSEEFSEE